MQATNERNGTSSSTKRKRGPRRDAGRSRKGCWECRKRKVKCDEQSPTCGQCRKAGRTCPLLDGLFRPHPYTFEVTGAPDQESGQGSSLGSEDGEPGASDRSLAAPTSSSTIRANNWRPGSGQRCEESARGDKLSRPANNAVRTAPTQEPHQLNAFDRGPPTSASEELPTEVGDAIATADTPSIIAALNQTWTENANALNTIPGPGENVDQEHHRSQTSLQTPRSLPQSDSFRQDGADAGEIMLFTRCFAEKLAIGMDLFSHHSYFRRRTFLLARNSALVRYATTAAAAKQLGHLKSPLALVEAARSQHSILDQKKPNGEIDYLWYGAKYYGEAIKALAADILNDDPEGSGASPSSFPWSAGGVGTASTPSIQSASTLTEARIAAAITMCQYELLSASMKAWSRHLDGIFKLFKLDKTDSVFRYPFDIPPIEPVVECKTIHQDLFWSYVRNDFEESLVTSRPTRINTGNPAVWKEMGDLIGNDGRLVHGGFESASDADHDNTGLAALRTLLWLMCRLVNHIATKVRSNVSPDVASLISPGGVDHRSDTWTGLTNDLQKWKESLPDGFVPDIVRPRDKEPGDSTSDIFATETWYSCSVCALAMMYYHMTRILLLLHVPSEKLPADSGRQDWLQTMRTFRSELRVHAKDLLAIALSTPGDALKMHMLQPLYIAGRCLTVEADQRNLIEMLKDLERSLGIATNYRVKNLIEEWGAESLHCISELDAELSDLSSSEN